MVEWLKATLLCTTRTLLNVSGRFVSSSTHEEKGVGQGAEAKLARAIKPAFATPVLSRTPVRSTTPLPPSHLVRSSSRARAAASATALRRAVGSI